MKRAFDLTVSALALVVTSPIIAAAALAVKLDSPGPAFYSGRRTGRGGREFRMHKLRSMRSGTDASGPAVTADDDARITRVGRFLRRTKIDELPQLWNVVKGEMSLVGPRPEDPRYVALYTPEQRKVLSVRPGVTGATALAFINEEELLRGGDPENAYVMKVMPQKLAIDLQYVEDATLGSDLKILGRTLSTLVTTAFGHRGAKGSR